VLVLLVAGLVAAGQDGAGFFLGVLVVLGVNRFFLAALSAALPHVVRRDQLVTANALSVTSGTIIAFVGGGAGYLLRLLFGSGHEGTALILVAAAALYVLAGLTATTLPKTLLGPDVPDMSRVRDTLGGVVSGLVDGARHLTRRPQAALALGAISFHRFLYGVVLIMTLLLCRNHFADDPDRGLETFALMLGVSGAGYFTAALITPAVVRRISKQAWTAWLLAGAAVGLLIFGTSFTERPWAVGAFLLGVVSQGVKLCVDTTLQEIVDDAYRGRVFAVYDMLFNATFAAAAAAAATWLPSDGRAAPTLLVVIVAYAAGAVAYRSAAARLRRPAHAFH
jgi:hypothetical protein